MTAPTPGSQARQLLCLTMLGYMKSGLTEDELYDLQVNKHAKLVSGLMEKYGVERYTITLNTAATRALLPKLFDPNYVEFADHDFVVRIIFPSFDVFLAMKEDPVYREQIAMDHLNFADMKKKTRMALGYVYEILIDGKVLVVDDPNIDARVDGKTLDKAGNLVSNGR